ncbi:Monoacylglycerol lipase ABHD12 [Favolaschia claudopus]|uniref:Monoacylglycerol lipase ABHD12 n=1 Tax=Favolaschia claudopus TaxID=2862362 RepID=A0AAW0DJM4_9AGAR
MSKQPTPRPRRGMLFQAPKLIAGLVVAYGAVLALILSPEIQTRVVYGHHRGFSTTPNFSLPEDFGLAPGKAVNLYLKSADNTTLGAWFVASETHYRSLPFPAAKPLDVRTAISKRPTILFLHGNSGHRAAPHRVVSYSGFSSRLDVNVLAIDYRGFGDSEGSPTMQGVVADARAGWEWLREMGAEAKDVVVVGHSLGTAIAALLAAELGGERVVPRGLVLSAPFASLRAVYHDYNLWGFLPLFKPLGLVPAVSAYMMGLTAHAFDTLSIVPKIGCPVLIAHAENDLLFPHAQSDMIFDAFLGALAVDGTNANMISSRELRQKHNVEVQEIPAFGTLSESKGERRLVMLKVVEGAHDLLRVEGIQDVMGRVFGFFNST